MQASENQKATEECSPSIVYDRQRRLFESAKSINASINDTPRTQGLSAKNALWATLETKTSVKDISDMMVHSSKGKRVIKKANETNQFTETQKHDLRFAHSVSIKYTGGILS